MPIDAQYCLMILRPAAARQNFGLLPGSHCALLLLTLVTSLRIREPHCSRKTFLARLAGLAAAPAWPPGSWREPHAPTIRPAVRGPAPRPEPRSVPVARFALAGLRGVQPATDLAYVARFPEVVQLPSAADHHLPVGPGGTVTAGVTYYCTPIPPRRLCAGAAVPYDHSLHAGSSASTAVTATAMSTSRASPTCPPRRLA